MKSSELFTGVLIGTVAGAILGILFAPDKGLKQGIKFRRRVPI